MSPAPASSRLRVRPARPDFAAGNEGAAGGEVDLHVEDGYYPRLDEIYLGSGGRHPVLDLDAGQGQASNPGLRSE
jgi:hypothetical protein